MYVYARFEVLTVVLLRIQVFWDVILCHWVIFWRVLVPWSLCSPRRVIVLFPGLGLLDPWRWRRFSPSKQEPLTRLQNITLQQIWIFSFDRMQHCGTENLNVREQLAGQCSVYILGCSVCLKFGQISVSVANVLSYLLHLTFSQPNVRSERWLRIHLSFRLSLVLRTPAPKSVWVQ
jgi:hypothetical protein